MLTLNGVRKQIRYCTGVCFVQVMHPLHGDGEVSTAQGLLPRPT